MTINDIKKLPIITEEKKEKEMSKNYINFYKNGNKTQKGKKVITYFERDNETGKQIIPEEKPVKENSVLKATAEYISIDIPTQITKNRLFTKEDADKARKKLKEDMNTVYEIFKLRWEADTTGTIDIQTYNISKAGEKLTKETFNLHDFNEYFAKLVYSNEPACKTIVKIENQHIFDPRKNNDYCIIDHVNSIEGNGLSDVYDAAYTKAKEDGFSYKETYSMKKFCQALNHCKNPSKEYKTFVRNHYFPKKVYLICNDINNYDAKYAYNCWKKRNIDIMVIQADQFGRQYKFNNFTDNRNRKIAETWQHAIGWEFEVPISRMSMNNNIDIYAIGNKEKRKELIEGGVKVTKITTRTDKFQRSNTAIASDKTINRMVYHTVWEKKNELFNETIQNGNGLYKFNDIEETKGMLKERPISFLDIDTVICTCCGKPRPQYNHKNRFQEYTDKIICPNCEAEFESDGYEFVPYYEDNYNDEFDIYLDDIIEELTESIE